MKKVYYILFAAMGLASCSSDEIFESPANVNEEIPQESNLNRRSYDEVLEIAQNSISMLQDSAAITRGEAVERTLNLESGVKAYCQKVTRANGASANDTLLYVFNFNDNKGYAVVSANRATEGLLAVVEKGSYDPNATLGNSFVGQYMQNAKDYVANAVLSENNKAITRANYGEHRTVTSKRSYTPKLGVSWGQTKLPGYYCPDPYRKAGSGVVALMHVMSIKRLPKNITTSYEKSAYPIKIDWEYYIDNFKDASKYPKEPNTTVEADFAKLFRELGYRAGASYGSYTSTKIDNLRKVLTQLGQYQVSALSSYEPENHSNANTIAANLARGRVVVMEGKDNWTGKTHTFVIDGGDYEQIQEQIYFNNWTTVASRDNYYHHINWGEGGDYNGYYIGNCFAPGSVGFYDLNTPNGNTTISGSDSFKYNMKYFTVE